MSLGRQSWSVYGLSTLTPFTFVAKAYSYKIIDIKFYLFQTSYVYSSYSLRVHTRNKLFQSKCMDKSSQYRNYPKLCA